MKIESHKNLIVWQKSMELVNSIYALTKDFPKEEMYGLTSQMRRAAISIPSNIAEGRSKRTTRDFIKFVNIAYGSAAELETQILISKNLDYISCEMSEHILGLLTEVSKMLHGLTCRLEANASHP